MSEDYPWRDGRTVRQVVEDDRELLVRLRMIEEGPGHSEREIESFNARLTERAPPEVIELYRAARTRQLELEEWENIGLFRMMEEDVEWYELLKDRPHPIDIIWWPDEPVKEEVTKQWGEAKGFMFGGTPFFDRLFIIKGHASVCDGSIVLTNHESDYPMVIVARSLAEYLARLCYFGGADLISFPGERDRFPKKKVMQLAQEYVELNPESDEF